MPVYLVFLADFFARVFFAAFFLALPESQPNNTVISTARTVTINAYTIGPYSSNPKVFRKSFIASFHASAATSPNALVTSIVNLSITSFLTISPYIVKHNKTYLNFILIRRGCMLQECA